MTFSEIKPHIIWRWLLGFLCAFWGTVFYLAL